MTLLSPVKLNLFLHITGRRADGYHTLQTVFQLLDYGDTMTFKPAPAGVLEFECSRPDLQSDENLVVRAARALKAASGSDAGAHIQLSKRSPTGAGLGGGSSNAATTLIALNLLWGTGLDSRRLAEIGLRLGADVPVFIHGKNAWAEGVGEKLTPIELEPRFYVVLSPPCHVSTAEIFSHQELTRDTSAIKMAAFLAGAPDNGRNGANTRNDCENLVRKLYPAVDTALNWLDQFAPARMTGTGASIFASFKRREEAQRVLDALSASTDPCVNSQRVPGFLAKGMTESPLRALLKTRT